MTRRFLRPVEWRAGERGVAMLEFVMMLPFVWVILALVMNFGMAMLERQRTMVAVREVGIRHAARFADDPEAPLSPVVDEVVAQNLVHRRISAQVVERGDAGECPGVGEAADRGYIEDAFRKFEDFIGSMSSSRSYQLTAQGQRPIGPKLSHRRYSMCFAIDGSPWTRRETGNMLEFIGSKIGELAGKIF